jgi:hypothetical protein
LANLGWRALLERLMSEQSNHSVFSALLGWSGWAAALSGVLFVVWGYIDSDDSPWYLDLAVLVLGIIVPLLFLVGLAGICLMIYLKGRVRAGWLSSIGFLVGFAGAGWFVIKGVMEAPNLYRHLGERAWATPPGAQEECGFCLLVKLYLLVNSPLTWLLVGVSMIGLSTVRRREVLRYWGLLLLTLAFSGWVYQLTDDMSGIVDVRSVHVAFGMLFSLSWMLLGYALWSSKTR